MSGLINLPTELLDLIVSCGLDLLDLGALFLTSKESKIKFSDVRLQQIFMDNTSLRLRSPKTGANLRTSFVDSVARKCIHSNDPTGIEVCFGKKRISSAISSLFTTTSSSLFSGLNRLDFSKEIFDKDADLVLSYVIQYFLANIPERANRAKEIIPLVTQLAESFIQFQKPTFEKHLNEVLVHKKTLLVVLDFFNNEFGIVFGWLGIDSSYQIGPAETPPAKAILRCFDKYPKYSGNMNQALVDVGMSNKNLKSGSKVTLLEYTCLTGSIRMFNIALQHGAEFDKSKPYLPLLLAANKLETIEFLEQLVKMGADFNVPIPSAIFNEEIYAAIGESTSILNYFACKTDDDTNTPVIEYILSKGGKLLPPELEANLKEEPNSIRYRVAKASQIESYHSFNRAVKLEIMEEMLQNNKALVFSDEKEVMVKLKMDLVEGQKRYKFSLGQPSIFKGFWHIENNFLVCKADRKKSTRYIPTKTRSTRILQPTYAQIDQVFKYRLFRTWLDQLAIVPDCDDNLSKEKLFNKMVLCKHK